MKSDIENLLNVKLTPAQRKHLESVVWLLEDNPRAFGRSYLMAVAFIKKALDNREQWIRVFDHVNCAHNKEHLFRLIHMLICNNKPLIKVTQFNKTEYKFKIEEVK